MTSILSLLNDLGALIGEPPMPHIERVQRPVQISEELLREAEKYAKEFEKEQEENRRG